MDENHTRLSKLQKQKQKLLKLQQDSNSSFSLLNIVENKRARTLPPGSPVSVGSYPTHTLTLPVPSSHSATGRNTFHPDYPSHSSGYRPGSRQASSNGIGNQRGHDEHSALGVDAQGNQSSAPRNALLERMENDVQDQILATESLQSALNDQVLKHQDINETIALLDFYQSKSNSLESDLQQMEKRLQDCMAVELDLRSQINQMKANLPERDVESPAIDSIEICRNATCAGKHCDCISMDAEYEEKLKNLQSALDDGLVRLNLASKEMDDLAKSHNLEIEHLLSIIKQLEGDIQSRDETIKHLEGESEKKDLMVEDLKRKEWLETQNSDLLNSDLQVKVEKLESELMTLRSIGAGQEMIDQLLDLKSKNEDLEKRLYESQNQNQMLEQAIFSSNSSNYEEILRERDAQNYELQGLNQQLSEELDRLRTIALDLEFYKTENGFYKSEIEKLQSVLSDSQQTVPQTEYVELQTRYENVAELQKRTETSLKSKEQKLSEVLKENESLKKAADIYNQKLMDAEKRFNAEVDFIQQEVKAKNEKIRQQQLVIEKLESQAVRGLPETVQDEKEVAKGWGDDTPLEFDNDGWNNESVDFDDFETSKPSEKAENIESAEPSGWDQDESGLFDDTSSVLKNDKLMESRCQELEQMTQEFQKLNLDYQRKISFCESQHQELTETLEFLTGDNKELKQKVKDLQDKLQKAKAEKCQHGGKVDEMNEKFEEYQKSGLEKELLLDQKSKEIEQLLEELKSKNQEIESLNSYIQDEFARLSDLEKHLRAQTDAELERLRGHESVFKELELVREQYSDLQNEHQNLVGKLNENQDLIEQLYVQIKSLQENGGDAQQYNELLASFNASEERIVSLEIMMSESKDSYDFELKELQETNSQLQARLSELEGSADAQYLEKTLEEAQYEIGQLKINLQESDERSKYYEDLLKDSQEKYEHLIASEAILKAQLEIQAERDNNDLIVDESLIQNLRTENQSLQEYIQQMREQVQYLKDENEDCEQHIKNCEAAIVDNKERFERYMHDETATKNILKAEIANLKQLLEEAREERLDQEEHIRNCEEAILQNKETFENVLAEERDKQAQVMQTLASMNEKCEAQAERLVHLEALLDEGNANEKIVNDVGVDAKLGYSPLNSSDRHELEEHIRNCEAIIMENKIKFEEYIESKNQEVEQLNQEIEFLKKGLNEGVISQDRERDFLDRIYEMEIVIKQQQELLDTKSKATVDFSGPSECNDSLHAELNSQISLLRENIASLEKEYESARNTVSEWEVYHQKVLQEQDQYFQERLIEFQGGNIQSQQPLAQNEDQIGFGNTVNENDKIFDEIAKSAGEDGWGQDWNEGDDFGLNAAPALQVENQTVPSEPFNSEFNATNDPFNDSNQPAEQAQSNIIDQISAELESTRNQVAELKDQINTLQFGLTQKTLEIDALHLNQSELKAETDLKLQDLIGQNETLMSIKESYEELKSKLVSAENQLAERDALRLDLEMQLNEKIDVLSGFKEVELQLQESKIRVQELEITLTEFKATKGTLENEFKLKEDAFSQTVQPVTAEGNAEAEVDKVKDLEDQLEKARAIVAQWEEYYNNSVSEMTTYYNDQIGQLNQTIDSLKVEANKTAIVEELEERVASLAKVVDEFETFKIENASNLQILEQEKQMSQELSVKLEALQASLSNFERIEQQVEELFGSIDPFDNESEGILIKMNRIAEFVRQKLESNEQAAEVDYYKTMVQNLESELNGLREEYERTNYSLQDQQHQSSEFVEKLNSLTSIVEEKSDELRQLEQELQKAVSKASEYESEVFTLSQSLNDLRAEKDSIASLLATQVDPNELERLKELNQELNVEKDYLLQGKASTETKIAELDQLLQMKTQEVEVLTQWQDYATGLETQIATLAQEKEALDSQLAATKENLDHLEQMKEQQALLQQQNSDLLLRVGALENDIKLAQEKENQLLAYETEMANLNDSLSKYSEEYNALVVRFGQVELELKDKNEEKTGYLAELDSIKQLLTEKEDEIGKQSKITETLSAQVDSMKADRDSLSFSMAEKDNTIVQYESEYAQLSTNLQELQAYLASLEEERGKLYEKIQQLEFDISTLYPAETVQAKDTEISRLSQLEYSLRQELDEAVHLSADHTNQIQELQKALEHEKHSVPKVKELLEAKNKIVSLEATVSSLKDVLASPAIDQKFKDGTKTLPMSTYLDLSSKAFRSDALETQIDNFFGAFATLEADLTALREVVQKFELVGEGSEFVMIQQLKSSLVSKDEANSTLRKLFSESQLQSMNLLDKSQTEVKQLREEFEELAVLFETTAKELETFKKANPMINSLERENNALKMELASVRSQGRGNNMRSVSPSRAFYNDSDNIRNQLKQAEFSLFRCNEDLQGALATIRELENRLVEVERDRNRLLDERRRDREIFDNDLYNAVAAERQRGKDALNFRVQELVGGFDATMNDMMRKHNHMEQMLDETERLLAVEREGFRAREQNLLEDLKYLQSERPSQDFSRGRQMYEIEQERAHLQAKMSDLEGENRRLRKSVDSQGNQFLKERYDLLGEISVLKQELEAMEMAQKGGDTNRIIKTLQEQKSNLEFALSQKEEKVKKLESMLKKELGPSEMNEEILKLSKQMESLEQMLTAKDADLHATEAKLNQLLNRKGNDLTKQLESSESVQELENMLKYEKDKAAKLTRKLDEIDFINKQLNYKLESLRNPISNVDALRIDFADLQAYTDEICFVISQLLVHTNSSNDIPSPKGNRIKLSVLKTQCNRLAEELIFARGLVPRLLIFRAELKYQKTYLKLKIEDLESSARASLAVMEKMGLDVSKAKPKSLVPIQKFKKVGNAVLAAMRMIKAAKVWKATLKDCRRVIFAEPPVSPPKQFKQFPKSIPSSSPSFYGSPKFEPVKSSGRKFLTGL